MILLLDTTVLIDVLRAKKNRRAWLAALVQDGHLLATAAVNIAEVYGGMRANEEQGTAEFLRGIHCYPMTEQIARRAGAIKQHWAAKGRTLSLTDTMVAATALEHDLVMATDNRKDFPMHGLRFHLVP